MAAAPVSIETSGRNAGKRLHVGDAFAYAITMIAAGSILLVTVLLVVYLWSGSELARHRFGEPSLLGAHPPGAIGSCDQKARSVGFTGTIFLFRHSPRMIAGSAVASLAVGGADAMSILRDLERGPVQIA